MLIVHELDTMQKASKPRRIIANSLVALNPECSSLAALPRGILASVTDHLEATSPNSLLSLRLVSSLLHHLATISLHREVILDLRVNEQASTKERCNRIEAEDLCSAVRSISFVDERAFAQTQSDCRQVCLTTSCHLLPRMASLESVTYPSDCVPSEILAALKGLPRVKLHTNVAAVARSESRPMTVSDNLVHLSGNNNLHTLDVRVTYFEPVHCRDIMLPLKRLLSSCPNLRCLTLNIDQPAVASAGWGPSRDYCGLGFVEGERMPPLEQLTLTAYQFGHNPSKDGHGVGFNTQGYPTKGKEIDFWTNSLDWTRLKRLQTFHGGFVTKLTPKLTVLEEFHFDASRLTWDVSTFCTCVPTKFRSISAPNLENVTLDGVLRHSSSLRQLRFHQAEYKNQSAWGTTGWDEETIDLASLQRIQEQCDLISELSLDIARSGDWPFAVFDVLALFPHLKRLEMWCRYGISDLENPVKPAVMLEATEYIFKYIRS